jgi:hypothetical protein
MYSLCILYKPCKFALHLSVRRVLYSRGLTCFATYLSPNCSGVTETVHNALTGHPVEAKQVWSTSVSNEVYFNLEANPVFLTYLHPHFRWVTGAAHRALPGHCLQAKQVWSTLASNEVFFTPET